MERGCDARGGAKGAKISRQVGGSEDVVSRCMALLREVVRALAVMRRSVAEGERMVEAQQLAKLRIDRAFDQAMGLGLSLLGVHLTEREMSSE